MSPPPSASLAAGPPPQVSPDEAEQQAVHLLACSADMLPAPLPPISMFDLLEALQVINRSTCSSLSSSICYKACVCQFLKVEKVWINFKALPWLMMV